MNVVTETQSIAAARDRGWTFATADRVADVPTTDA